MTAFPTNGKNTLHQPNEDSLQAKIERILTNLVNSGLYDAIYIFDETGLPIVQRKKKELTEGYDAETIEISTLMSKIRATVQQFADFDRLHEITIEGQSGKKLIFRYIDFFGQTASLIAIIPSGKSYRNITNNLIKTLDRLTEAE